MVEHEKKYHKGRFRSRRIWMVQHENWQPVFFTNPTSALEYGKEEVAKVTNDYDGSKYIEPDAMLHITGFYINDKNSPCWILTDNLFNEELILKNNQLYDIQSQEREQQETPEVSS